MQPEQPKQRGPYSIDGINLGILLDDYLAIPASEEEQAARQRSMILETLGAGDLLDTADPGAAQLTPRKNRPPAELDSSRGETQVEEWKLLS